MATSSQSSKDQAMLKWFNQHRQEIIRLYKSQYIAYSNPKWVVNNLDCETNYTATFSVTANFTNDLGLL